MGPVQQVEDLGAQRSRSGAYGDEDYGHTMMAFDPGDSTDLASATRRNQCCYRVRFGLGAT